MATKKIQQPMPDFEGLTPRHCGQCRSVIRTRRQVYCKTCKRQLLLKSMPEERIAELDASAAAKGYGDWYAFTDSS